MLRNWSKASSYDLNPVRSVEHIHFCGIISSISLLQNEIEVMFIWWTYFNKAPLTNLYIWNYWEQRKKNGNGIKYCVGVECTWEREREMLRTFFLINALYSTKQKYYSYDFSQRILFLSYFCFVLFSGSQLLGPVTSNWGPFFISHQLWDKKIRLTSK